MADGGGWQQLALQSGYQQPQPWSLQKQCLLTITCHTPTYAPDYLALLPPRLRTALAFNLSAVDLHRMEQSSSFFSLLETGQADELWRHRYETTLTKFSNVAASGLDLDMTTASKPPPVSHQSTSWTTLSWKDRYLLSCLMNIPTAYSEGRPNMGLTPLGVALYGVSDLCFQDGQLVREAIGTIRYGLKCMAGRGEQKATFASNFVSKHYLPSLSDSTPFNQQVGEEWPISDRIQFFSRLFPQWALPYVPIQYDEISSPVPSCPEGIKRVIVYSGWHESRRNGEISEEDERPVCVSDSFKCFFDTHSQTLDTAVLLAPAVQKCRESKPIPLSVTTTTLAGIVMTLPALRHLSITMHSTDTSCLDAMSSYLPSLYHCLQTLHFKVVRPKFENPCTRLGSALSDLYGNCCCLQDVILQGLAFDEKGFQDFMLAFLNTPPANTQLHHTVTLRSIKILPTNEAGGTPALLLEKQAMPQECQYRKSLYIRRMINVEALYSLLSAYDAIFLDRFCLSTIQEGILLPPGLTVHAKTVRIERMTLNDNCLECIQPALTGRVNSVELSLGNAFPFINYASCINMCSENLRYLDFNWCYPYGRETESQIESLFVTIFSLPPDTLSNLELNLCHIISNYAARFDPTSGSFTSIPYLSLLNMFQAKKMTEMWKIIYSTWLKIANGVKLKGLHVTLLALEELNEELASMADELITELK